jgi:mRNA-degrading endonuclease toxin of MazEF toxin-antitoxin module
MTHYTRGTVVLANLGTVEGNEQNGIRPVAILSNLETITASRAKRLFVVAPFTRSHKLIGPLAPRIVARQGGLPYSSTALVMHVRSLDPTRIVKKMGRLNSQELEQLLEGLRIMLES